MPDEPEHRVLDYREAAPAETTLTRRRRILYCVGLPLVAFGLCHGLRGYELDGLVAAVGALLVAMALPVRD